MRRLVVRYKPIRTESDRGIDRIGAEEVWGCLGRWETHAKEGTTGQALDADVDVEMVQKNK